MPTGGDLKNIMEWPRTLFEKLRVHRLARVVTGSALLILGIFISDLPTMIMSPGWPTTEGVIVTSRNVAISVREWVGDFYVEQYAYIRYEYEVEGTNYSSSAVNAISLPFSYYPRRYAIHYPVGKQVSIYYNPRNPESAVLEPGLIDVWRAFDVFSYLCFAAGIYWIIRGTSRRRDPTGLRVDA